MEAWELLGAWELAGEHPSKSRLQHPPADKALGPCGDGPAGKEARGGDCGKRLEKHTRRRDDGRGEAGCGD